MPQKQTLKDRYNDEFFEKAEARRQKLSYKKVSVGQITNERIKHVLELLYQTHQCYYFGLFKASINLGGGLLEQSLILLLEELLEYRKSLKIKIYNRFETITSNDELSGYNLSTLVSTSLHYNIIQNYDLTDVILLKHIRNKSIHDILPQFEFDGYRYKAVIDKKNASNIIEIDKKEIDERLISTEDEEIYAYYVLTRTRELMRIIFEERVKEYPPDDF